MQGESTLHSSTPQESSSYTAVAASTSEESDAVPPPLPRHELANASKQYSAALAQS